MTCQADLSESGSPQISMTVMSSALPYPAMSKNQPIFHAPIFRRELVKCNSGNMGKGQLQRQHHLAERKEIVDAAVAANANNEHSPE